MDKLFDNPVIEDSIISAHFHTYSPFLNSFNKSDIIRIQIQTQNLNIMPSTSLLYIEGTISKHDGTETTHTKLTNNAIPFLFDEIHYQLNGKEIDHIRNAGITTRLKRALYNTSWSPDEGVESATLFFNFCIPFRKLLGFAEDYKKIIPNAKHELILVRSRSDDNSLLCTDINEKPKILLTKVQWKVQHINLTDAVKLKLYQNINDSNSKMILAFRNWDLYEYPTLPQNTDQQIWNIKTTSQIEKPRYIIFALQTYRTNQLDKDAFKFDHCNVSDLKVYLNSEGYPYESLNLLFGRDRYGTAYELYSSFRNNCYNYSMPESEPLLTWKEFKKNAMILITDTRYQNESLKF
ncbi:uncharacterized protein LOC129612356 [Condylostylus longicornis]|uniref:uncharacterized protein LOC129612356 n=1 Tax=Condylostylus longicornis TaxID=2530218 RepID=UPI00244D999F|nr:uncharacterized protein LOC129612356 [Condylostylus longicornis]